MPDGKVAPSKNQVSWRIRKDVLERLNKEAKETGYSSVTPLVNHILFMRYFAK